VNESSTEVWSQIKEKYWDRDWDVDEMLADDERSHDGAASASDD
jgi:hypothetical protein